MGVVGDTNCNESVGKERRDSLECAVYLPEWKQKGIEGEKKEWEREREKKKMSEEEEDDK